MSTNIPHKIVLKSTTKISLNERFSNIQVPRVQNSGQVQQVRAQMAATQHATAKNRRLAQQMANRPAVQAALRLKKKSLSQRLGSDVRSRLSFQGNTRGVPRGGGRVMRARGRGRGMSRSSSQISLNSNTSGVSTSSFRGRGMNRGQRRPGRNFNNRGVVRGNRGGRGRGGVRGVPQGVRGRGGRGLRRGGRGVGRGARGARGAGRGRGNSSFSREQLDNQLDEYMTKTKGYLDTELDQYMAGGE